MPSPPPPTPANAAPSPKVKEITLLTFTPMRPAVTESHETARIPLPSFVRKTMNWSSARQSTVTAKMTAWMLVTRIPPNSHTAKGKGRGEEEKVGPKTCRGLGKHSRNSDTQQG